MAKKTILQMLGFGKSKGDMGSRKHPRLRAFNLIKFTLSDGTQYESLSNVVNLSESGLQFTCYEALHPDQMIRMLISIPHANKEVPVKGKLVWVRKDKARRGVFVAGVQFQDISDENRQLIREMVESRRPKRKS
jgi:Tfp pilus assembly protein PilZ